VAGTAARALVCHHPAVTQPDDPVAAPAVPERVTRPAPVLWRARAALRILAGLACLAGFVLTLGLVLEDRGVQQDGVRTTATVAQVFPDLKSTPGYVVLRYAAGDVPEQGRVEVGSSVEDYVVGQVLTARYDPAHPRRVAIDGVDDALSGPVWVVPAFLAGGLWLLVTGVRRLLVRRPVR
jgi:hypothetical protein